MTCCIFGSIVPFAMNGFLKPIWFKICMNTISIEAIFTAEFQKIWLTKTTFQDDELNNAKIRKLPY